MILFVREVPLEPGDGGFEVRYVRQVVPELADLPKAQDLMDELEAVISIDPFRPPGRRAKKLSGAEGLWRYRPRTDNGLRVLYAVEAKEVWILGLHPRSTVYRRQNLKAAVDRFRAVSSALERD